MYRKIHIGSMVAMRLEEAGMTPENLAQRLKMEEEDCLLLLSHSEMSTSTLLRISKILRYDFFRIYSMHLLLYAPPSMGLGKNLKNIGTERTSDTGLPVFAKNTYTREVIQFILQEISSGNKSPAEVISDYKIPKTTLYRWIIKYSKT